MRLNTSSTLLATLCAGALTANAAITQWQTASQAIASNVTNSTTAVTTPGTAYDYGTLNAAGGQTIEYIFNATDASDVTALGAVNSTGGSTSFRLEQWSNTGLFGATNVGVSDATFTAASIFDADTHVAFVQNGGTLELFVNGVSGGTVSGWADLTGGNGTLLSNLNGSDPASGTMYAVASYDTALSSAEINTLYTAYTVAVPEPSSTALLGLGGIALMLRRRK